MQIGNFLQYDNVDVLGNALTYSDPCKFNAKFKGSNCIDMSGNEIRFGSENILGDVKKLTFRIKRRSGDTSGRNIFINAFSKISTPMDYVNSIFVGNAQTSTTNQIIIGKRKVTFEWAWWNDWDWHFIEISYTGSYEEPDSIEVLIDGVQPTYTTNALNAHSTVTYNRTMVATSAMNLCDIRTYNSNGELTHHYPCSEGIGKILYDVVGGIHAYITSSSQYSVWSYTQDIYHYNLTNGYISIDGDDCNRFTNTLKIPLKDPTNVLIVKDNFDSDILDIASYGNTAIYNAISKTIQTDTDGSKYLNVNGTDLTYTSSNFNFLILTSFNGTRYSSSISSPYLNSNYNFWLNLNPKKSVKYKIEYKIRARSFSINGISQSKCRVKINGVYNNNSNFGIWGSSAMYCAIDNEWHTISTTNINGMGYSSTISSSLNAGLLNIVATAANDIVSFDFDIKDIRIYRVDNNTYHPPIENGHNGAETLIDFSDNTPNTAEVLNDLFYKYRPGLITTSDESMGANGSMRANGWQGAMDAQASATAPVQITNGLWAVMYANPNLSTNANTRVGYIDNYTLSQEELDLIGLSTTGVKSQAVQFTTGTGASIIGNSVASTCLFYRIDFKTLLGNSRFPNVLAWSYKVHFSGWAKKIPEYDVGLSFGVMYRFIFDKDGRGLGPAALLSDNQWHYIDKTFEYYLPNMDNSSNNSTTNAKYIGIAATPSNYANFINPDTGVAYTATEASHRPAVAMAKVKITFEPSEVYFKDGSHFKLYNYSNTSLSNTQTIRANNQTNFKL